MALVDGRLQTVVESAQLKSARYTHRGWMRYGEMDDLVVDFGMTDVRGVGNQAYVCDESMAKVVSRMFKNMDYMYQIISQDELLRTVFVIPVNCLVKYKGFSCLVTSKIDPRQDSEYNISNEYGMSITQIFERLAFMARVDFADL
jgi:hypothetical protein